ncbi:hypothetical protein FACS18942_11110 [Planctomycetales bacterium]|nr:hypothetical protein FACS18942_11110 [Planctomycetales bacterium]
MTVQLDNTIRKLNESEQMLRQQAMYDSLTGLPNRYLLQDRFEQYVAGSQRSGESFFCSVVDLDYFKQVNDTYGHYTGDVVLQEFAQKISLCLRDTDTAARIGGDEFIFICTCHKNEEKSTATMIMKRFYNSLKMPIQLEQISYYLHSSIGISFFPQHASDLTALLAKADEALYYSKARGRNTYTIWNDSLITDGQQG